MKQLALSIPGFEDIGSGLPTGVPSGGLYTKGAEILQVAIELLLVFAILFCIYLLIRGGINLTTSGGHKEKFQSGRERVRYAIIGLIFIFLSFFFIGIIGKFFGIDFLERGSLAGRLTPTPTPTRTPTPTPIDCATGYNTCPSCTADLNCQWVVTTSNLAFCEDVTFTSCSSASIKEKYWKPACNENVCAPTPTLTRAPTPTPTPTPPAVTSTPTPTPGVCPFGEKTVTVTGSVNGIAHLYVGWPYPCPSFSGPSPSDTSTGNTNIPINFSHPSASYSCVYAYNDLTKYAVFSFSGFSIPQNTKIISATLASATAGSCEAGWINSGSNIATRGTQFGAYTINPHYGTVCGSGYGIASATCDPNGHPAGQADVKSLIENMVSVGNLTTTTFSLSPQYQDYWCYSFQPVVLNSANFTANSPTSQLTIDYCN